MNPKKIREDFPSLQQRIGGKPPVYFDNACMTLRPRQVIDAMNRYYYEYPACAGRSIHKFGNKVTEEYEKARETIARFIGAKKSQEVVFTRNTTEGINLVANAFPFRKGEAVLTTDREHNSNLIPWQILSKTKGTAHRICYSKNDMTFDLETFGEIMDPSIKLVSVVHTSNLDGYTTPIKEIAKIAHDFDALVLADGAQSVPHRPVNVRKLGIDFLAFSGHKMLGPAGSGVLYGRLDLLKELNPFMAGGDTVKSTTYKSYELLDPPEKFEAGLQNYPGAIGLAEAARYLEKIGKEKIEKHDTEMNRYVTEELELFSEISVIGPQQAEMRSSIFSFNIKGLEPHDIAIILDDAANIMIRSGQHCVHSWFDAHKIKGSARASFYLYNTLEEAKIFVENLKNILKLG
jgi:cysteine desulfurase/selenocysteine lyase